MAITNYTDLQTTIEDFLNRDDLTAVVPTFIQLAEAQMNREIRHWQMIKRSTGQNNPADQYAQVPADWLETIRLHATDPTFTTLENPITMISRDQMLDLRMKNNDNSTKTTYHYTLADGQFNFYPTPTATLNFELMYYSKIPSLSAVTATNWLLTDHPDAYLYGSLIHSAPYLAEDARVAVWAQMYSAAVSNVNRASEEAQYSGSGMKLKVRGMG
jgi:hypothetical protein